MIDVEINEILGSSLNVFLQSRPLIPSARRRFNVIEIPGREGILTEVGQFEPTEIDLLFNFIDLKDNFHKKWDAIKSWLSATNCKLTFSDDQEHFYKISRFDVSPIERPTSRIGRFSVKAYTVDGLKYVAIGNKEYSIDEVKFNRFIESKPIYKFLGDGECVITINGKTVKANVRQNLTIDTEKMLSYSDSGILANTALTGEYSDLHLLTGNNDIAVSAGFNVKVIPNWRCL